jgi:AsmA protein
MMKTLVKVLAGIVVLIMVAVVGFIYTFDANNYKEEITDMAEAITGRSLTIGGDMGISLYPWIGIKIHDVTIGNPDGFSKRIFATVGQFDVRIKIVPLLQRRLDVDRLVLHRLDVNFEKNSVGDNNWSDISDMPESDNTESIFGLAGLVVGGIDITDSSLTWLDTNTTKHYKISNMSLSAKAVNEWGSLPVEFKAYVESNQPEWQAAIKATANLDFDDDTAIVNANDLKLAAKALLPGQEMNKLGFAMVTDSTIDLQAQTASLKNARLSTLGLVMSGTFDVEDIFSVPVIQGPLKVKTFEAEKLAEHMKFDIPRMTNTQALKKISLSAALKTDFQTIHVDNIAANVDESRVNGFVHIETALLSKVRYALKIDKVKLDDYTLVENEFDQNEKWLPMEFLRTTDLEGELEIETVALRENDFENVHVSSSIKNGIVKANPITMLVKGGELKAAMQLDARKVPAAVFVAKVKNADAETSINPLLQDILGDEALTLEGLVNADVDLKASGTSMAALKRSVEGKVKVNMDKVTVRGVDFDHASRSVVLDYAKRNDFKVSRTFKTEHEADSATEFKSLSANFEVSKGKLLNRDLSLVSDGVNVTGSGSLDFINGKLDYRPVIDMNVKNTQNIRDKLRDHPMQYRAQGLLGKLTYAFDVDKYDLWVGRLMIQEAKAHRNRRVNTQSAGSWENVLSK